MEIIKALVSTHLESNPISAADLFEALKSIGVEGTAASIVVAQSGPQRHQNRVHAVLDACTAFAEKTGIPKYYLCLLDIAGVGGARFTRHRHWGDANGLTGEGTLRAPGMPGSRKQQASGGAWDAARDSALIVLADEQERRIDIDPTIRRVDVDPTVLMPGDSAGDSGYDRALEPYGSWIQSLAYQVLTGTFNLDVAGSGRLRVLGTPAEWARLFNEWEDFDPPFTEWRLQPPASSTEDDIVIQADPDLAESTARRHWEASRRDWLVSRWRRRTCAWEPVTFEDIEEEK